MKPPTFVFILLVLALAGVSTLAWRQWSELGPLRVAAGNEDDRAALLARVEEFKRRNYELEAQLTALRLAKGDGADPAAAGTEKSKKDGTANGVTLLDKMAAGLGTSPESKRDEELELIAAMADMPEFQKLLALEQRGKVDAMYAGLFKKLHLSPDELARMETLLADKRSANADVAMAVRDQGLTGQEARDVANKMVRDTQKQIDSSINDLLGPQRFGQYVNYERTAPQRETVDQLSQRLSYTGVPLTSRQSDQLVQVLATTAAAPTTVTTATGGVVKSKPAQPIAPLPGSLAGLGISSTSSAPITTAAVSQAQTFLAPAQVAALQRMQQEQQAQQTLGNLLRTGATNPVPKPVVKPASGGK